MAMKKPRPTREDQRKAIETDTNLLRLFDAHTRAIEAKEEMDAIFRSMFILESPPHRRDWPGEEQIKMKHSPERCKVGDRMQTFTNVYKRVI